MRLNPIMTMFTCTAALALLLSALQGCATAEAPSIRMTGMSASFDEPDGVVMWFDLVVTNEDIVDLPLAEVRYRVSVDGKQVFQGVRSAEATAPARGEAVIRLPASASISHAIEHGATVTISGRLTYLTPSRLSELLFDADVFRPEQGFSASAMIPDLAG